MASITSSVGLVSGIDSRAIIDQLIKLEEQPKTQLQNRIATATNQKSAYQALLDKLNTIRDQSLALQRPLTFNAATATSSNDDVLSATASNGAALGSYQFRVARLVTAQQSVSSGFADFATQRVGAGTITVEQGGGEVNGQTLLADLNGGAGVRRGQFRVTDRSGASTVIDAAGAVSLDDVVKKINTSVDVRVKAKVDGDKLVLTDATGSTLQNLIVQDLGDGKTAADLGIQTAPTGVAGSTLTGTDVNFISTSTALSKLNDGLGVRRASTDTNDVKVTTRDGGSYLVNLRNTRTVGDVAKEFDAATGGKVKLTINAAGDGLTVTDTTAGGSAFAVTGENGSNAAADLGILNAAPGGGVVNGKRVLAGINTTLLKTLNGGQGLNLGQLRITDRSGTAATIDLSGLTTVQDVLDTINNTTAGGFKVTATVKESGNGIQIVDATGGAGDLVIDDITLGTATALGLNGTFANTTPAAVGKNLQRQWVNENSLLSTLNGGKGVTPGLLKVTNAAGGVTTVDLTGGTYTTLGDVIKAINSRTGGLQVTAGVNANGDGLLLTDASAGAGKLKVEDQSGTLAADLGVRGQATGSTLDGSYERTVVVSATDTLTDVTKKLTDLRFGLTANVINDGSGATPYRLSLTATNSGRAGRVVFDSGTTGLGARKLVEAQDAAVFVGGQGGADPLLVTGSSNQLTGVLPGVNIELHAVSDAPVSLGVTRSADSLVDTVEKYVDGFNEVVDGLKTLTAFNPETSQRGLLLGDSAAQSIQAVLYEAVNQFVPGAGRYRTLNDVGIKIGDEAKLEFDEDKFRAAYATDATAVEKLFTSADRVTTQQVTTGGILTNGVGADGSLINYLVTGGSTVSSTITNGPIITDGTTYTGGTPVTVGGVTTVTGAVITKSTTKTTGRGFGYLIERALTRLTDPVDGIIPQTKKTIDGKVDGFRDRVNSLTRTIQQKRERLERQFSNMESTLSKLQGQQQSLGSLNSINFSSFSQN